MHRKSLHFEMRDGYMPITLQNAVNLRLPPQIPRSLVIENDIFWRRREYVHVGSKPASMLPTLQKTSFSITKLRCIVLILVSGILKLAP